MSLEILKLFILLATSLLRNMVIQSLAIVVYSIKITYTAATSLAKV